MKTKMTILILMTVLYMTPHLKAREHVSLANGFSPRCELPGDNLLLTAFPFYDNVEDSAQSASWWTYDPTTWKISMAGAHGGIRSWECSATSASNLTIVTPFNLSTATNPYISFWVLGLNANWFYIKIDVSINGGTTWTETFYQYNNELPQWTRYQQSLQNFKEPNVLLRFRVHGYSSSSLKILLDDILIDNAPTPGVAALSLPNNNGMRLTWTQSTASDFGKYRIVLSNNQSNVNTWNYSVGNTVSGRAETRVIDITSKTTLQYTFTDLIFTNTHYWAKVYEQDTQELFNQGTETADLWTSFNVTPQNAPFVQTFEGTFQWAADIPWTVTTADAGMSGHSPTRSYEDSPGGNYPANADRWLVFQANCNTMTHPVLKFNHRYSFDQVTDDYGEIAYSYDNNTFTSLGAFSGNYLGSYQPEVFDLSPLHGQSPVYLRFRTVSGSTENRDGWYLDDVEISDRIYSTTFPFTDDVEDSTLTHQKWVRGNWRRTGGGRSGFWAWQCRPVIGYSTGRTYLSFSGPVDLSAAANPFLQLWVKIQDHGFYLWPEVSVNGGQSWTILSDKYISSTTWARQQWSLENFQQADVLIRIGVYKNTYNLATCLVDDILIDNAATPGWFILSDANNNGMKAMWQMSTAADFSKYRLIISTTQSTINNWDQTVGTTVSGRTETRVIDISTKTTTQMIFNDLVFANTRYYARLYEMDTQGFFNQGSEAADIFTTFSVIPEVAPFVQSFEGSIQWAADKPWAVTEADAGFPGHSQTKIYEDSPGGNYPANADRWLVMQANCNTMTRPVLRFNHRYSFDQETGDYGELAYSINNSTWTPIGVFSGNYLSSYQQEEFDLSFLKGTSPAYIRYRTISGGSEQRDGWRLDDVEIYNSTRTTPYPFYDDIENDSIAKLNWLRGVWKIAGGGRSGLYGWKLDIPSLYYTGDYLYLTLNGTINLTATTNPELSFWYRMPSSSNSYLVQASSDGGTTWATVSSGYFSGSSWAKKTVSLSAYKQANVLIRIGIYGFYPDPIFIDDILIAEALVAPVLVAPANAAAGVAMPVNFTWNASPGAPKYQLQVATANTFGTAEIVYNDSTITTTGKVVAGLTTGNTYYWRVRAINIIEERGPWSTTWSFTTGGTTSDVISLSAGWNLISFDITLNPNTPAQVFAPLITAGNLLMVTGYQGQQGKFFDPNGPPFLNTLLNLADGEGYWVKVQSPATLTKEGTPIPPGFSINLLNGWNLIAYWPQNTTTPAAAFASLISAGKLVMVTGYEGGGKFFDPNGPPFLNTLTEIKNGFGYWVKVNSNHTFTYPQ